MDTLEIVLLYDYYGDLLTDRQKECFEMRYNQDLSLGEIGQALGVSRQAVCDNLTRTEALLRRMEETVGCVSRDLACRRAAKNILDAAQKLCVHPDEEVSGLAQKIRSAAKGLQE